VEATPNQEVYLQVGRGVMQPKPQKSKNEKVKNNCVLTTAWY
jgi:hypothetical protein